MPNEPVSTNRRTFIKQALAAGLTVAAYPKLGLAGEEAKLNFYNYDIYTGKTTLDDFHKATGIKVKLDLYADCAELLAKLKGGNPGYDVFIALSDYVEQMRLADMLIPLDYTKIPNIQNIEAKFRDVPFDPGRKHSVAYTWGTLGIGYRKSKVDGVPDSWKWLLDSAKYSRRIALLGDAQTTIMTTLKYLGHSLNTKDAKWIEAAGQLLSKQKPHIKVFSDNGQNLLAAGEVDIVMEWNGDVLQVMREDDDLAYVVPKEGGMLWQDSLCIPKGAPHPDNAHKFINFILEAHAGAAIAETIQYATPNAAAKALMPAAYRDSPAIFPKPEIVQLCETPIFPGAATRQLYDKIWTRVLAS